MRSSAVAGRFDAPGQLDRQHVVHLGPGEAAAEAIAHARTLGFAEVIALILPYNAASRRVAEKVGMKAAQREVEHAGLPHVLYRVQPAELPP